MKTQIIYAIILGTFAFCSNISEYNQSPQIENEFIEVFSALDIDTNISNNQSRVLLLQRGFKNDSLNHYLGVYLSINSMKDSLELEFISFEYNIDETRKIKRDSVWVIEKQLAKVKDTNYYSVSSIKELINHMKYKDSTSRAATDGIIGLIELRRQNNYYYVGSDYDLYRFKIFKEIFQMFKINRKTLYNSSKVFRELKIDGVVFY